MKLKVLGFGFRVLGIGFRVWGFGFTILCFGCRDFSVLGLGFLFFFGFRVCGLQGFCFFFGGLGFRV